MRQRKTHIAFLHTIRFYLRQMFPLLKRLLQLAVSKKRTVSLEARVTQSGLVKEGHVILALTVTSENVFMLNVNGLRIPVFRDRYPVKVTLALDKEVQSITLYGRGIGQRKIIPIPIGKERQVITNVRMKRKSVVEPAILSPRIKLERTIPVVRKQAFSGAKTSSPTIRRKSLMLSQTLTGDLIKTLAHNFKNR